MSDISTVTVNNTTYDLKDANARAQNALHHVYYVKGTQTASTGSWTGVLSDVSALYEGLAIDYWLPFAGSGNATLNLTLKDGTTTGPINCYQQSTNRFTTHVPEKTIIHLVYQTVTINGTDYTGWWYTKSQDTNDRAHILWHYGAFVADSAIYRYQLLFQKDENTLTPLNNANNDIGTSKTMLTNVEFDPFGCIYYWDSTATKDANATVDGGTPRYAFWAIDLRYTFNCGTTLTAHKPLYLKTSLQSNGMVKLASASPLAQALPTTNDGYLYIYLGRTGSNYQLSLTPWHPIYFHDGTSVVEYKRAQNATTSMAGFMSAADKTKLNGLDASSYAPSSHQHSASDITSGTLSAERGGTGQSSLINAANSLINSLSTGESTPGRDDYLITQYVNGGTTTTTYHRRKISTFFKSLNSSDITTALGYTPTSTSVFPNNTDFAKSKYRVALKDYTGSGQPEWYYPLVKLPKSDASNYASVIVSGRIGGWTNDNINYYQGIMWNREGAGIASLNISGGATSESAYFTCVDFVIYKDGTTNEETVYIKCKSYFVFDLDIEVYQYGASIVYDGTKLTTTPSGTLTAQASTSTKRMSLTNGKLYINGTEIGDARYVKKTGDTMTGNLTAQGQILTSFHNAVAMGTYVASASTVPNLCEELRYSSGAAGSVNITDAYTKDGVTVSAKWYNFLWIPHRSGGVNGAASGDNCNYGTLFLTGMTGSGFYLLRYSSSAIAELKDIYKDNDTDVKVTNTLATTTKYYVTGTTSNSTNTGTQSFDTGIYSTTTAGQLNATTYKVNEQVTLQWNATDKSLDFVFA